MAVEQFHAWIAVVDLQVRALSALPPGGLLHRPPGGLAQSLLDSLMADSPGGVEQVAARFPEQVALLALARALDVEAMILRVQETRPDLTSRHPPQSLAGAPAPGPASWFDSVDVADARAQLTAALAVYRAAGAQAEQEAPTRSSGVFCDHCLLADLLSLPATSDAVDWLMQHRPRECALPALIALIGAITPHAREEEPRRSVELHQRADLPRLSIRAQRLDIFSDRFELHAEVRFRTRAAEPHLAFVREFGLWGARDDRGYRYVLTGRDANMQSAWLPGRYRGEFVIAGWPAPAAEARSLRFEAAPAFLDAETRRCACGRPAGLLAQPLGDLAIDVTL